MTDLHRAEQIARRFHEEYEALAPLYAYDTREESEVPWSLVTEPNRTLMIHVVDNLMRRGTIS